MELVLLSRSPSVVSVALQLPESESKDLPTNRLIDKLPSSTSLWQVLRRFEEGVAGGAAKKNFTQRGVAQVGNGTTGSGRLYYETPVLHIVGRDYTSFTDLQKSLAQIGINAGSVLLKLNFRTTETPLEESLEQISRYFESVEVNKPAGAHANPLPQQDSKPAEAQPERAEEIQSPKPSDDIYIPEPSTLGGGGSLEEATVSGTDEPQESVTPGPAPSASTSPLAASAIPGITARPVTIFAPPSSTTPQAARLGYNPADYEPTADHAKQHQARLASSGRNKRLLTDSEIAAQEAEQAEKLASVSDVELKIRYPDGSQVVSRFSAEDRAQDLYKHVRSLMEAENEPFNLSYVGNKGPKILPKGEEKLVKDLGLKGRVTISFLWEDGASPQARMGKSLKPEAAQSAKPIHVPDVPSVDDKEGIAITLKEEAAKGKPKSSGGVPKWLKGLPGKKR